MHVSTSERVEIDQPTRAVAAAGPEHGNRSRYARGIEHVYRIGAACGPQARKPALFPARQFHEGSDGAHLLIGDDGEAGHVSRKGYAGSTAGAG